MVEDLHSVVSDEELYLKIEETILVIPEVKGFTSEGLQNIVKGITSAFGKKVHKGILIRHDKNGMTINIFISLIYGCHVHEVGYLVQKQVQREILLLTDEPVLSVDVAVTEVESRTMSRSKAREHALKVLYAKEINPNTAEISADISDALSEKGKSFSDFLIEQVQLHRDEIDGEIVRFLKKWSLSQLNIVDKNILRIAIAEFNYTYEDKADRKVIINEAVELAKAYGGENSYRFINGILSAVTGEKNG